MSTYSVKEFNYILSTESPHFIYFETPASLTSVTSQSCTSQERKHLIFLFDPSFKALNLKHSKSLNPSNVIMLVGGWTAIISEIPNRRQTQFMKSWSAMPGVAKIPGILQESQGKPRTLVQAKSTLLFSSVLLQASTSFLMDIIEGQNMVMGFTAIVLYQVLFSGEKLYDNKYISLLRHTC